MFIFWLKRLSKYSRFQKCHFGKNPSASIFCKSLILSEKLTLLNSVVLELWNYFTCDILALIAAFEGSVDVASIANKKRH